MFRCLLLSAAALVVMLAIDTQTADARRNFSLRNPYTSFNISGINYGSMNWERTHNPRNSAFSSRRTFFRR